MPGVLIALCFLVFLPTLRYRLTVDDVRRLTHPHPCKTKWEKLMCCLRSSGDVLVRLEYDHLINIMIHLANVLAIYFFFGANPISFLAAALFAIHPVNAQVGVWLNGKRYGLNTFLVLLMYFAAPIGVVLYPFTALWQINALLAPMLYLAMGYWKEALFIVLFFFLIRDNEMFAEKFKARYAQIPMNSEHRKIKWQKIIIFIKTLGYYFRHCVLPWKLAFFHSFLEKFSFTPEDTKKCYQLDRHFWIGLVVAIGLPIAIALNWGNLVGFGLFWWLLFIIQWCHFPISVTQAVADRYCYLPNVGLMLAIATLLTHQPVLSVAVFTYYFTRLLSYMPAYDGLEKTYDYCLQAFPDLTRIYLFKITALMEKKLYIDALVVACEGARKCKNDCMINLRAADLMMAFGFVDEAENALKTAEENILETKRSELTRTIKKHRETIAEWRKRNNKPKAIK